jgi:hypothetical protein
VRFENLAKFSYEIGGGMGYQDNNIRYGGVANTPLANLFYSAYYLYYNEKINSSYQTAFFCGSILSGNSKSSVRIGFTLKTGAGYIYNYNYNFSSRYGDYDENPQPDPHDQEIFKFKGGIYYLLESSFLFQFRLNRANFHVQMGYNYCSAAVSHTYYFEQSHVPNASGPSSNRFAEATKDHPTYNPVVFMFGLDFPLNRKTREDKP